MLFLFLHCFQVGVNNPLPLPLCTIKKEEGEIHTIPMTPCTSSRHSSLHSTRQPITTHNPHPSIRATTIPSAVAVEQQWSKITTTTTTSSVQAPQFTGRGATDTLRWISCHAAASRIHSIPAWSRTSRHRVKTSMWSWGDTVVLPCRVANLGNALFCQLMQNRRPLIHSVTRNNMNSHHRKTLFLLLFSYPYSENGYV